MFYSDIGSYKFVVELSISVRPFIILTTYFNVLKYVLQIMWIITWPIHLVFLFTIPDCDKPKFKKWFPLTFIMCIIWIGSLSYIVAWMITIIGTKNDNIVTSTANFDPFLGDTLKIPDSVMGITFLAAGTSVPEAVSSVIVAKQGKKQLCSHEKFKNFHFC